MVSSNVAKNFIFLKKKSYLQAKKEFFLESVLSFSWTLTFSPIEKKTYLKRLRWTTIINTYPGSGPDLLRSYTCLGFNKYWNFWRIFMPCFPPLFGLTNTNKGRKFGPGEKAWNSTFLLEPIRALIYDQLLPAVNLNRANDSLRRTIFVPKMLGKYGLAAGYDSLGIQGRIPEREYMRLSDIRDLDISNSRAYGIPLPAVERTYTCDVHSSCTIGTFFLGTPPL